MNILVRTTRAELFRLRRWPAVWVTIAAWLLMNAMFGYIFDYVTYNSGDSSFSNEGASRAEILSRIVPSGLPGTLPQGMPLVLKYVNNAWETTSFGFALKFVKQ